MPDTIQFKNGHQIINKYDASGKKLSTRYYTVLVTAQVPLVSTLTPGKTIKLQYDMDIIDETGTFYVDNFEYGFNGCDPGWYWVEKIYNPEGYVTNITNPNYCYFRKDHLGNNREVWRAAYSNYSGSQPAATIQRTQYYPSGLPWAEGTGQEVQNKKYNGKEWIEMHGLDEYDYGARHRLGAIQVFTTLDPLAELNVSISPYVYCSDNPVNRIDPTGLYDVPEVTVTAPRLHNYNNNFYNSSQFSFVRLLTGTSRVVNGVSSTSKVLDYADVYRYLDVNKDWLRHQTKEISKLQNIKDLGLTSGKMYQKLKGLTKISSKLTKATKTLGVVGNLVSVGEIGVDVLSDGAIKPSSMVTGGLLLVGVIFAGPEVAVGLAIYGIFDATSDIGDKINKQFDNKELNINPFK